VTQNSSNPNRIPSRQQQVFTSNAIWGPFPEPRLVDVLLVGGGGGGSFINLFSDYYYSAGGVGGAGGQVIVVKDFLVSGPVSIVIGAGGHGATTAGTYSTDANGYAVTSPFIKDDTDGTETSVISTNVQGDSAVALGGRCGSFDYLSDKSVNSSNYGSNINPDYTSFNSVPKLFNERQNGRVNSSSGGSPNISRPENGKVFGNQYSFVNQLQTPATAADYPATSGYAFGAGGGGGFSSLYPTNPDGTPVLSRDVYWLAKGRFGSGSALGGTNDAAPNSGGGGSGTSVNKNQINPNSASPPNGALRGGNGGSGIVIFAWND
jgi:hypothetical protein